MNLYRWLIFTDIGRIPILSEVMGSESVAVSLPLRGKCRMRSCDMPKTNPLTASRDECDQSQIVDDACRSEFSRFDSLIQPRADSVFGAEVLAFTISRLMADSNLLSEGHWWRVVRYVQALADAAPAEGEYLRLKDPAYLDLLTAVAPLYDLGQLAVPRNILMKPDRLEPDERSLLQTHTTQGAEVVKAVLEQFGTAHASLRIALELVRSHHERWDGLGYPDRLAGETIPLSARVVAIVANYEAMRSRRPHRPPLSHMRTVRILTTECSPQFDPTLLTAFKNAAEQFDRIHQGL